MRNKPILSRRTKYQIRTAVLIFFLGIKCFALPGKSSEKTSEKASDCNVSENFQSALDAFQKQYGFPGATAAYVLRDGTVGSVATGLADIEHSKPMKAESRMLSASIGKTFVGATAIALSKEGVLDLDVPISRWLGYRRWFPRLPNHNKITLRHLLTHSSGLPDHVHMESFATGVSNKWQRKNNPFSPEELIEFVLNSSSLRYYPDYGISIAFQINTDIGIVDDSTPVIREMELRLAGIVLSGSAENKF